jgi:polyphosphate kinase
VHHVFNYLNAYSERSQYTPLFVAPLNLGKNCASLIEREAANARSGRPGFIVAKVNSLLDEKIIQALYEASQAGVEIDLIIRGACALVPGVPRLSSRIRVRSVIGRFLEHSRIFVFGHGGKCEVYLGSADWMPRNIYERVEVMFPVKDPSLRDQILAEVVVPYLGDTQKTRFLMPTGEYVRRHGARRLLHSRNGARFNVQEFLVSLAEGRDDLASVPSPPRFLKVGRTAGPKISGENRSFFSRYRATAGLYNRRRWKSFWRRRTGFSVRKRSMNAIRGTCGRDGFFFEPSA